MAESINLTVDRREDMFVQVYWTDLDDVPFYVNAAFLDAASGGTVLLSSDPSYASNPSVYAVYDNSVTTTITSQNILVDSDKGLITIKVPYSVVSAWAAGSYPYSLVVKYTSSASTASSFRKVLMTGSLVVA